MRMLNNPNGLDIVAIVPDAICSAFDEDLFIEIIDSLAATDDGDIFNITVNGKVIDIIMWNNKGRYYFDDFFMTDFSAAAIEVNITAPFEDTFYLLPKKSIGDVKSSGYPLIPLWSGKNVISLPYPINIDVITDEGEQEIVNISALAKQYVNDIDYYFYTSADDNTLHPFGAYTEEYTEPYRAMMPISGYYNAVRVVCSGHVYFEWLDADGLWRSWYFMLKETKVSSKSDSKDIITNISGVGNERRLQVDRKKDTITRIFSTGFETKSIIDVVNSIKSSSYVFMGADLERVNVKSEDTTDIEDFAEFSFSITNDTKAAL